MSKISYCSLEEAWGNSLNKNQDTNNTNNTNNNNNNNNNQYNNKDTVNNTINTINTINSNQPKKDYNEEVNMYKSKSQMEYESLKSDNENLKKILNTMNYVERNKMPENNINEDYNQYRFNPLNKVNSLYQETNNYQPFQDDVEKKSLQDRFVQLENEFRKYKTMIQTKNTSDEETIESFSNQSEGNDIQDLIVLIVLGLIIIFIMDNIFKLGKYIGAKGK
jgi:hypothetical protein